MERTRPGLAALLLLGDPAFMKLVRPLNAMNCRYLDEHWQPQS
jgi:hypothetical protein